LKYRRLLHATNAWDDPAPQSFAITGSPTPLSDFHAARDESGRIWVAVRTSPSAIRVFKFNPASKAIDFDKTITTGSSVDSSPNVVPMSGLGNSAYVFWRNDKGIQYAQFLGDGTGGAPLTVPGTTASDLSPNGIKDDHFIWLTYSKPTGTATQLALLKMFDTKRDEWGDSRPLSERLGTNSSLVSVAGPGHDLFSFWTNFVMMGNNTIFYKRITTGL
jgi:hypothetical protein